MAQKLKSLKVREISTCPAGANQLSQILFYKSGDRTMADPKQGFLQHLSGIFKSLLTGKTADGKALPESEEDQVKYVTKAVEGLEPFLTAPAPVPAPVTKKEDDDDDLSDQLAAIAKAADEKVSAAEAVAKAAQVEAAKATADAKATAERVAKLEAAEEGRVTLAKARDLQGALPGKAEDLAKAIGTMTKEQLDALTPFLKAGSTAQAMLATRLSVSVAKEGSAEAVAKARAVEIRKANPKLTEEQAVRQAYRDDKSLYEQHKTEQSQRSH